MASIARSIAAFSVTQAATAARAIVVASLFAAAGAIRVWMHWPKSRTATAIPRASAGIASNASAERFTGAPICASAGDAPTMARRKQAARINMRDLSFARRDFDQEAGKCKSVLDHPLCHLDRLRAHAGNLLLELGAQAAALGIVDRRSRQPGVESTREGALLPAALAKRAVGHAGGVALGLDRFELILQAGRPGFERVAERFGHFQLRRRIGRLEREHGRGQDQRHFTLPPQVHLASHATRRLSSGVAPPATGPYLRGEDQGDGMTTFDERERAFETKFARDQEVQFKIHARRNRLVALWAAGQMDLPPAEAETYVGALMHADLATAGDADILAKLHADLSAAGVDADEAHIRAIIDEKAVEARRQYIDEEG